MHHPFALRVMKVLNLWLPRLVYCTYPILLLGLAICRDERFFAVLLVPATAFVTVTVMRRLWNLPRPYEKLAIEPLIPREKKGHSFPSRHVASVTIIAVACFYIWPPLGIAMAVIGLFISIIRPLAGIHFPLDVVAGMALSLVIGIIGFWLL